MTTIIRTKRGLRVAAIAAVITGVAAIRLAAQEPGQPVAVDVSECVKLTTPDERLACSFLHRGRSSVAFPEIKLSSRGESLELRFPPDWLDDHPLTVADLQIEIEHLKSVGFRLRVFSAK